MTGQNPLACSPNGLNPATKTVFKDRVQSVGARAFVAGVPVSCMFLCRLVARAAVRLAEPWRLRGASAEEWSGGGGP